MQTQTYKGKGVTKDQFGYWVVSGFQAWGDQPGEHVHRFKTRKQAKAFIDRMTANNEQ